jgi:hypothetical protein
MVCSSCLLAKADTGFELCSDCALAFVELTERSECDPELPDTIAEAE